MAKLFSAVDAAKIQKSVQKSKQVLKPPKSTNTKSIANELNAISQSVIEYFQGSEAILITSKDQLHDYVTKVLDDRVYFGNDYLTMSRGKKKTFVESFINYVG